MHIRQVRSGPSPWMSPCLSALHTPCSPGSITYKTADAHQHLWLHMIKVMGEEGSLH